MCLHANYDLKTLSEIDIVYDTKSSVCVVEEHAYFAERAAA
jgi:hypothetical protein